MKKVQSPGKKFILIASILFLAGTILYFLGFTFSSLLFLISNGFDNFNFVAFVTRSFHLLFMDIRFSLSLFSPLFLRFVPHLISVLIPIMGIIFCGKTKKAGMLKIFGWFAFAMSFFPLIMLIVWFGTRWQHIVGFLLTFASQLALSGLFLLGAYKNAQQESDTSKGIARTVIGGVLTLWGLPMTIFNIYNLIMSIIWANRIGTDFFNDPRYSSVLASMIVYFLIFGAALIVGIIVGIRGIRRIIEIKKGKFKGE